MVYYLVSMNPLLSPALSPALSGEHDNFKPAAMNATPADEGLMKERKSSIFNLLAEPVRDALGGAGILEPTEPQKKAIPPILKGENILLTAPTGSGKTEACMLPIFSKFLEDRPEHGISLLYITPLRALNRDMLRRMTYWANHLEMTVEVRHGDTPQSVRRRQAVKPPDMLITTPETLQAILPGRLMRRHLSSVRWVLVDEVHELAEDKRGAQLTIALERLARITTREFQRIGVSATVGSPATVAKFLTGTNREVKIIEVFPPKDYCYHIERPIPGEAEYETAQKLYTSPEAAARLLRIRELVETHSSTLIFVNSRQNAEMLGLRFNILGKDIGVHHGSLSREERHRVEDELKAGRLKGVVCTSTLELGIDIGSVDLVVQYLSPRQVSPFIQRVGRSGHRMNGVSQGTIITAYSEDTLESMAVVARAFRKELEPTKLHENALDVLAHQIAGLLMDEREVTTQEAFRLIRQAYPYRELELASFLSVIELLETLGKVHRHGDRIIQSGKTRTYYFENLSMIPDERIYPIIDVTTDRRVGVLGEEFMSTKAKVGLNFICRGLVWQIVSLGQEGHVYVKPINDPTAAIPGWDGEILPVPFETAQEVGRLRRRLAEAVRGGLSETTAISSDEAPVERYALRMATEEVREMINSGFPVPDDRIMLAEGYDHFVVLHCAFGEGVNRALGYLSDYIFSGKGLVRNWWADGYRLLVELSVEASQSFLQVFTAKLLGFAAEEVDDIFRKYLDIHFPFGYTMKFVAERFGILPRGIYLSDLDLDELWQRNKETPVGLETIREVRMRKVDLNNLKEVLSRIRRKEVEIRLLVTQKPSPFAYRMLNQFAQVPEMMAPETVQIDSLARMKSAIEHHRVQLFCINCGELEQERQVKDMPEQPHCQRCGSGLLAAFHRSNSFARESVLKRLSGQALNVEEQKALAETRRNADVVLSYGKKGIVAMSVRGIGPQTAARILAKMHLDEAEFYKDLLNAKILYMETRQYWKEK